MTAVAPAAPVARPLLRRASLWLGLAAAILVGAVVVAALGTPNRAALDPASAQQDGSKALVRVLEHYGARVAATRSLSTALAAGRSAAVVVTAPDAYSAAQLRSLQQTAARVVLVRPDNRTLTTFDPGAAPAPGRDPSAAPGCNVPAAVAAGRIQPPGDGLTYDAVAPSCYAGLVVVAGRLVVLGSAQMLQNGNLADRGIAALDVNLITADRALGRVTWLQPGSDAAGPGPASVWDLFPAGTHRVAYWLLVVGVLLALWRGRRLGGVITEPLPVVVRAAELVEGHGRLYRRAGARDRAAGALRAASERRLAGRASLPPGASPEQIAAAIAPIVHRAPAEIWKLLAGPAPETEAELLRLANDLGDLEAAAGGAGTVDPQESWAAARSPERTAE